jgi:hypothetical protein
MLNKAAGFVLATLRGSTYRSIRLASLLDAALLEGLFEHSAWCAPVIPNEPNNDISTCTQSFSVAAVGEASAKGIVHDG